MRKIRIREIPQEWQAMARVFVALGDQHRQRILLAFHRGERLTVGQIVAMSPLSRPAISHHLKILRQAGVLSSEKVGKEVFVWVNKALLERTLGAVLGYVRRNA